MLDLAQRRCFERPLVGSLAGDHEPPEVRLRLVHPDADVLERAIGEIEPQVATVTGRLLEEDIESIIDYDLDYNYDYFALTTLTRAYLLKYGNETIERPQDLWMRVAISVSCDEFDFNKVKKTYVALSSGQYTHATPTLFNSGLKMQKLSSCFLIGMEDDSIEGIFNTIKDCA